MGERCQACGQPADTLVCTACIERALDSLTPAELATVSSVGVWQRAIELAAEARA